MNVSIITAANQVHAALSVPVAESIPTVSELGLATLFLTLLVVGVARLR